MEAFDYFNLHTNPDLSIISYKDEASWLELRKEGIGGSDVAAVMGLNKYMSALKLYKIKTGALEEDLSDNVFIKKGKDLEYLIRDKYVGPYMYERGYLVRHPEFMIVNKNVPWLQANVDGIAVPMDENRQHFSENIIIEIKWVSEYAEQNWFGEEYCGVPANYYAQVQHYMVVTGAKKAIVCALFDSDWSMHYFEVPYNAAFISKLVLDSHEFFYGNVRGGIEPKPKASMDKAWTAEALKKLPDTLEESDEMTELCAEYQYKKGIAKSLSDECTEMLDKLVQMHLNGKKPVGWKFKMSECATTTLNATKLKAERPDIYDNYKQTSVYTRTTIRK